MKKFSTEIVLTSLTPIRFRGVEQPNLSHAGRNADIAIT